MSTQVLFLSAPTLKATTASCAPRPAPSSPPNLQPCWVNRPVRVGRPLGFGRLPPEAKSASFAVPTGLLVYPQFAHLEHVEPRHTRQLKTGTHGGYFGKVGQWLREGF